MSKKLLPTIGLSLVIFLIGYLLLHGRKSTPSQAAKNLSSTQLSVNIAGSPSSQDPEDIVPGLYKNLIQNTATKEGFTIQSVTVENNTDETGKAVGDHLEIVLKNTTHVDLTNFEVYYTITDSVANKKEGYYKKLTGFVLKSGSTSIINFDNQNGPGHFSANTNSIYYTSANALHFDVMVASPGYKVQISQADKAAGGAETKD